jgi:hypothetical protein
MQHMKTSARIDRDAGHLTDHSGHLRVWPHVYRGSIVLCGLGRDL